MIERRNSPVAIHERDEQLKEQANGEAIGVGHGIEGCRSHLAFVLFCIKSSYHPKIQGLEVNWDVDRSW